MSYSVTVIPAFRANTSGFANADQGNAVNPRLAVLRDDLASGTWDGRHGALRTRLDYDAGFRFVAFRSLS